MSYTYQYPRPSVTADIVLLNCEETEVLLVQRGNDPYKGTWAFPGGFFDMEDYDILHTAIRELEEETGLKDIPLKEVCSASRAGRDPRGRTITIVFKGYVDPKNINPKADDDAAEAKWWPLNDLPELAFDHQEILEKVIKNIDNE